LELLKSLLCPLNVKKDGNVKFVARNILLLFLTQILPSFKHMVLLRFSQQEKDFAKKETLKNGKLMKLGDWALRLS
jgi:hypothetical protein